MKLNYKIFEKVNNYRIDIEGRNETMALADFLDIKGVISSIQIHYATGTGAIYTFAGVKKEDLENLIKNFTGE
ncbi:MAG: hypothetical protein FWF72_01770 [Paludibacter sp.]|nr:hypothetical protein [Paludibacter sp.]